MMRVERLFIAGCFFSLILFSGKVLADIALSPQAQAKADLVAMGYPNARLQYFGGMGCSCSDTPNSTCEQRLNKSLAEFTAPVGAIFNIYWWHNDMPNSSGGVCGNKGWSAIGCYISWQCGSQAQAKKLELYLNFSEQIQPTYRSTSKNKIEAIITDQNNSPQSGVIVTLNVESVSYSGGHDHDSTDRPDGVLTYTGCETCNSNTVSITTDSAGKATIEFIAPQVSGTHVLTASCSPTCEFNGADRFKVGIEGLVKLQDSEDFGLIGATAYHKNNHYVTPEVAESLYDLAFLYHERFPNDPVLKYNDASLETGGRFDLNRKWITGSHKTHRLGRSIDVRANSHLNNDAIPHWNYLDFEDLVERVGGTTLHELFGDNSEHYHLSF